MAAGDCDWTGENKNKTLTCGAEVLLVHALNSSIAQSILFSRSLCLLKYVIGIALKVVN